MIGPIPYGCCHCGCGEKTNIAPYNRPGAGWVKGEPLKYIKQHHRRLSPVEYIVDPATGCWVWQRARRCGPPGYGVVTVDGVLRPAHRVEYEKHRGPIPDGLQLDHLCRNPPCVNPDHLEPVTARENLVRGVVARGPRTHCRRGHEFTEENTYVQSNGRTCRTCSMAGRRARRAEAKAAA